jgi:hypothetical protein
LQVVNPATLRRSTPILATSARPRAGSVTATFDLAQLREALAEAHIQAPGSARLRLTGSLPREGSGDFLISVAP